MQEISSAKLIIATILLSSAACLPNDAGNDSTGKSLDNFAAGGVSQLNWCGSNSVRTDPPRDIRIETTSVESRNAVLGTLASVPDELLYAFRNANGKIVAAADASTLCARVLNNNAETDRNTGTQIPSCWYVPQGSLVPHIVISSDPRLIRHSLIRAFSYFFTEYFLPRSKKPEAGDAYNASSWQAAVDRFEAARTEVTKAFLEDVAQSYPEAASRLRAGYDEKPFEFSNYVLAEALDSCYCSEPTRTVFQVKFPKTWAVTNCRPIR